jgi:hypothetical protein
MAKLSITKVTMMGLKANRWWLLKQKDRSEENDAIIDEDDYVKGDLYYYKLRGKCQWVRRKGIDEKNELSCC